MLKISQEELGFRSELHRTFISELERGLGNPTITTLDKLALALETTKTALIRATETARPMSRATFRAPPKRSSA